MAVLPRVEMRLVRGSRAGCEVGVMMTTTPVEVPPLLLAPAMLANWMWLAPFLVVQGALHAAAPVSRQQPPAAPGHRPLGEGATEDGTAPRDGVQPMSGNVVSFPARGRRRS